ncbi:SNF2-related protein [Nitrosococcus watsonii]|uniref:SNF2-related protein n=1 Tax=Nitrosococcus watsoni (strain C-113) TaxID=105559 RepID=D8K757_NITWC|nr:SNF2-related protein [Nitrosococcus watsonii]ADJ28734.1 SNF2-related protein [Nitrosococcus watsonii C-113]
MSLKEWITGLVGAKATGCAWNYDSEGINFIFTEKQEAQIHGGGASDLLIHQYIALSMLVEQGRAEELPNGVLVPSDVVVQLDENTRLLLGLPDRWKGVLNANIKGKTGSASFQVELAAADAGGGFTHGFAVEGPVIRFSAEKRYVLSPAHLLIFEAYEKHAHSAKMEYDDLRLVLSLQKAQELGASISLGHFGKLNIRAPASITVAAELDEHGRLVLTPRMGQAASHERIQRVLGQLRAEHATSLRVDGEIILFDEEKLAAVREILRNRVIPKDKVSAFLKNPTAFINASFVDLDLGFSARVKGATKFRHAYFGETDESGIDWFGKKFSPTEVFAPAKLVDVISDGDQLDDVRQKLANVAETGAQEMEFGGRIFDVSNPKLVNSILEKLERKLIEEKRENVSAVEADSASKKEQAEPTVVDIGLNDVDLETPSASLNRAINDVLIAESALDWGTFKRLPFPHQVLGTRWILGLALDRDGRGGGLLADDMGLGKTFMSLAAMEHLYKSYRDRKLTEKPCLVVAPLSLLQNWKDEVGQTFKESPFNDIVILQSDGRLSEFRAGGVETKNQNITEDETAPIRYSLKIGSGFAQERLDLPKRLVITTYQMLRDYQFSLCSIDWGIAVFDEAQNIKNPNALQTRAAKGVKADFRLIATGTPVENSLTDFWCLMDTACPGLLDSYQAFRSAYITPILRAAGDEIEHVRGIVGRRLREHVGPWMLRRVKEDNLEGLPDKSVFVGMKDDVWAYCPALHSTLEGGQFESYNTILMRASSSDSNAALAALQKLRDVSLHPRLVFGGGLDTPRPLADLVNLTDESGKIRSLLPILDQIRDRGEKCIIFVINKKLQAFLALTLAKIYLLPPVSVINGDAKAVAKRAASPTRQSMIRAFEERDGFNVIIMSPIAAGVGLTVVGANNVIHLERHWNPAKEAQATDRVYRIGQKRKVNVFIPLIHHPEYQSFDVNLHQLLSRKGQLKDAVVTPVQVMPSPEGLPQESRSSSQRISFDELRNLSWQQFEALCAELLYKEYQADNCWLTHSGADFGADVVLTKDGIGLLIQCKHTSGSAYDGYKAILEVHSATVKYEAELGKRIDSWILATNAVCLGSATQKAAKQYSVEILDGKTLSRLLGRHAVTYADVLNRLEKKRLRV